MAITKRAKRQYSSEIVNLEDMIPQDHFLKVIKKKMFGYNTRVICENNNYILTVDTNGSNMHNSASFYQSFENLTNHFDISKIDYFVGDAAYLTAHTCKLRYDTGISIYKKRIYKKIRIYI